MNKFDNLLKKLEVTDLLKESLNTFTYNLPDNRSKRLFDFYTFASLDPLVKSIQSSDITIRKKVGEGDQTDSIRTYGSRKLNTNFIDSFWKSLDKCYIELAKEMMDDIFFCIAAEFHHINQDSQYSNIEQKIPEYLNRELYKNYINNNYDEVYVPVKKGEEDNISYNPRYEKLIRVLTKSNASKLEFAELCAYIYENFDFHPMYSGPKWTDASNAFLEILEALPKNYRPESFIQKMGSAKQEPEQEIQKDSEDAEEGDNTSDKTDSSSSYVLTDKQRLKLFIAIDHTWGLSHNTGPTFNKLISIKSLSPDNSGQWLQKALDKRTQDENLFRFINTQDQAKSDVSKQMVPIIKRVIYSYYGATNEKELYEHVNKTNPIKIEPPHVPDIFYRYCIPIILDKLSKFQILEKRLKSHYVWCSFELTLKDKINQNIVYASFYVSESIIEGCITDEKNNYSFDREGLNISREYINSKGIFKLKPVKEDRYGTVLHDATKSITSILLQKYENFGGTKVDINKTNLYKSLDENSKENLKNVDLGEVSTLIKVIQFCDDLKNRVPSIKVEIKDNQIEVNNKTTSIVFIGVEPGLDVPQKKYSSSPDSEDYFAGKRKKTSTVKKEDPIVRFSFTANKDIGRNFIFVDEEKLDVYNFIQSCLDKFNIDEDGNVLDSNELKSLKSNLIKQFNFSPINTTTITNFPSSGGNLIIYIPPEYRPLFKTIKDSNSNDTILFGNNNNNYVLKIRAEIDRMTNPYSIDLMKDDKSILNKTFRYPSITDIQNNFKSILHDIIDDVIDSEKENIKKSIEEESKTQESKTQESKSDSINLIPNLVLKIKEKLGNTDISYYLVKLNLILQKTFGKYESSFDLNKFVIHKASVDDTFLRVSLRYYLSETRYIRFIIAVSNSPFHNSVLEIMDDLEELFSKLHKDFIGVNFTDELNKVYSDLGIISKEKENKKEEDIYNTPERVQKLVEKIQDKLQEDGFDDDITAYNIKLKTILNKLFSGFESVVKDENFQVITASYTNDYFILNLRYYTGNSTGTSHLSFIIDVYKGYNMDSRIVIVDNKYKTLFNKSHKDFIGVNIAGDLKTVYTGAGIISKKEKSDTQSTNDTKESKATKANFLIDKIKNSLEVEHLSPTYSIRLKLVLYKIFEGFESVLLDENFVNVSAEESTSQIKGTCLFINFDYIVNENIDTTIAFQIIIPLKLDLSYSLEIYNIKGRKVLNEESLNFLNVNIYDQLKKIYIDAGILSKKEETKEETKKIDYSLSSANSFAKEINQKILKQIENNDTLAYNLFTNKNFLLQLDLAKLCFGFKNIESYKILDIDYDYSSSSQPDKFVTAIFSLNSTEENKSFDVTIKKYANKTLLNITQLEKERNTLNIDSSQDVTYHLTIRKWLDEEGTVSTQSNVKEEPKKEEPKKVRTPKSPELLNLLNNISVKAKADIATSGLSKFMMPFLTTFLSIINPYGDSLKYTIYSDYNKAPDETESLSLVLPMTYTANGKKANLNLKMFFSYNKNKPEQNKFNLYDDPQDQKNNPNAFNDFKSYLLDVIGVKKPLKDSVDMNKMVGELLKSFLLKG